MTTAVAEKQIRAPKRAPGGDRVQSVIGSAAGAIMRAEGVELMLDESDAEVGRRLKEEVRLLRSELKLVAVGSQDIMMTGEEPAQVDLPPIEAFASDEIEAVDVVAEAEQHRRGLLNAGQLLTSGGLQAALSLSRQAVSDATRNKRMFTVDVEGQSYYPAFFARGKVDRKVLEAVSRALGSLPGWTKWDFFTAARESFSGLNALDALARGKNDVVIAAAERFLAEESD
jgi:hypothetical protein